MDLYIRIFQIREGAGVHNDVRIVKLGQQGLSFDDVLLLPSYSDVLPKDVSTTTNVSRTITINIPIVSSPRDTVTEARMATALAREGGIGIIHRNMSIEQQADEVDKVKRSEAGMIVEPVTLGPDEPLTSALEVMEKYHISGVPITEPGGRLVGILTNRDIRFCDDLTLPIGQLMTRENLVTVPVGTTLEEARAVLHRHRIEKLPVVDDQFRLRGLITVKDIQKKQRFPAATKDERGRLRVGAAVGVGQDSEDRVAALLDKEVDVLVVDTAHGHSRSVIETVRRIKRASSVQVIAGNVATPEGLLDLVDAGADGVRVGMGPGAICTTRVVAGAGVPQMT